MSRGTKGYTERNRGVPRGTRVLAWYSRGYVGVTLKRYNRYAEALNGNSEEHSRGVLAGYSRGTNWVLWAYSWSPYGVVPARYLGVSVRDQGVG